MTNLAEILKSRDNNFNFIRMVAALFVLISHSFPISGGATEVEPLLAQFGFSLGGLGVFTFFCISGFFISLSYERSKTNIDFIVARFLRLYPALLTVLILCALVIGPIFSELARADYFSSHEVYSYITGNLKLKNIHFQLPGLFQSNPYPGINGSLWTLYYEVLLYLLVFVLGVLGILASVRRVSVFFLLYATFYLVFNILLKTEYIHPGFQSSTWVVWSFPFVLGMGLYAYRHKVRLDYRIVALLWFVVFFLYKTPVFIEAFVIAWSYSIFYVAFNTQSFARQYNRLGDYSYGLYIYAFPTQEIIAHLWRGISPEQMIFVALPIALVPAVISWHLIEHPCILRKRNVASRLSQFLGKVSGLLTKNSPNKL